jgi:hypothetical protein
MQARLVILLTVALALPAVAQKTSCPTGDINGRVVDALGKPVPNAEVRTLPEQCTVVGLEPAASTDDNGNFHLRGVPEGLNTVFAKKEYEGYPDARFAVFASETDRFPNVVVKPAEQISGVIITLGPKGGVLSGRVVDGAGQSVITARVVLARVDKPQWKYSRTVDQKGEFRVVLPARALHFSVTAPGYETWEYAGPEELSPGVVQLRPNDRIEISVPLKRERKTEH